MADSVPSLDAPAGEAAKELPPLPPTPDLPSPDVETLAQWSAETESALIALYGPPDPPEAEDVCQLRAEIVLLQEENRALRAALRTSREAFEMERQELISEIAELKARLEAARPSPARSESPRETLRTLEGIFGHYPPLQHANDLVSPASAVTVVEEWWNPNPGLAQEDDGAEWEVVLSSSMEAAARE